MVATWPVPAAAPLLARLASVIAGAVRMVSVRLGWLTCHHRGDLLNNSFATMAWSVFSSETRAAISGFSTAWSIKGQ
jgi:hypothetical protein